jgi:hypothetical protein
MMFCAMYCRIASAFFISARFFAVVIASACSSRRNSL